MRKLALDDLKVRGTRVLVRVDFNVPLQRDAAGRHSVSDGTRVLAALPTVNAIRRAGGKVILMSHLGRPQGVPKPGLSLSPIAAYLADSLKAPVAFVRATVGREAQEAVDALPDGGVLLLENTRFHPGEPKNDPGFASSLAALGDVFVNDAFGTAHRAHASNVGVASHLPQAAAGYLLQRELKYLGQVVRRPGRPFIALVGGAKVSDKIGVLSSLVTKADTVLVGGAMSYTFLKALGHKTGNSLVEDHWLQEAEQMYRGAGGRLRLPLDHVISAAADGSGGCGLSDGDIPPGQMGLDIGPRTMETYRQIILDARTVVWNGPVGVFEIPAFAGGTCAVAQAMAEATRLGATTVVGGGDSVAAVTEAGLVDKVTHVCTGGGAMLDFLEGKTLPGVAALSDKS